MSRLLQGSERWSEFYRTGRGNIYPDENLVRLVRGQYTEIPRQGRVLDVGFGRGANLIMLAQTGYEAYGLEVNQESIIAARELAKTAGVEMQLALLTGTTLPFDDGFFDLVVSWNAVYYYGRRSIVGQAIDEFRRVLRRGGVLLMSVIHPNSFMSSRLSGDLGDGAHRIERPSPHDNREGLEIFYAPTSSSWLRLLSGFDKVEEGYAEADLFNRSRRDAWRLFLARKTQGP